MADETVVLDAPAAATPSAAPAKGDAPVPAASGTDPIPAPAGSEPAPAAGAEPSADDWRKAMAGEDADALKELGRYNSQADVAKALVEAKKTIRKGDEGKIKLPGADATPEELAAFHKTIGVPEKPDGYKITAAPPEGMEVSEADKAFLSGVTEKLHAKGGWLATPEGVNAAHTFYYEMMQEQAAQMAAAAVTTAQTTDKELKTEWGSEHKINMTYANSALTAFVPSGKADDLLNLELAGGGKLGANKTFIQMMASAGRATTEDAAFLATLNGGEGMSADAVDDEIKAIQALRTTDSKAYDAKAERYKTLLEMQRRRNQRSA